MEQQETTPVTTRSAGIRYGLIGAVVSIAYFVVLQVAGVDSNGPAQWLNYVFAAAFIFLAHKYYKDNGDGFMDYSQGVGISFWVGLVSSVISSIFMYVYIKFIDSTFMDKIRDQQITQMQEKGMSDEQIEQAMKYAEMFSSPEIILVFGIIGGIIVSVVIGLIVSAITQKKRPIGAGMLDS